ncbi:MAG: hypothetical protein A2X86_05830 [Bdellovibrionales bacterium GWA2_49_15]|nr:MAG: hypothetical protein A2X86_05830 [Bdellovibrionales bacterium GWA2_49_15]
MSASIFALNLSTEIHKIPDRKKTIYFSRGIFHNGNKTQESKLKAVRHSFYSKEGYERLVIDFESAKVPKIYGGLLEEKNQLHLDFFKVMMPVSVGAFGNSVMVDAINFFPIQGESLTLEINFKFKVKVELFTLENPARLVVDLIKI